MTVRSYVQYVFIILSLITISVNSYRHYYFWVVEIIVSSQFTKFEINDRHQQIKPISSITFSEDGCMLINLHKNHHALTRNLIVYLYYYHGC